MSVSDGQLRRDKQSEEMRKAFPLYAWTLSNLFIERLPNFNGPGLDTPQARMASKPRDKENNRQFFESYFKK